MKHDLAIQHVVFFRYDQFIVGKEAICKAFKPWENKLISHFNRFQLTSFVEDMSSIQYFLAYDISDF